MNLIHVAAALAVLALGGSAFGAPSHIREDESAHKVDLLEPLGHVYFLKCDNGYDVLDCERPSIWEQTNGMRGLQTIERELNGVKFPRDVLLIG